MKNAIRIICEHLLQKGKQRACLIDYIHNKQVRVDNFSYLTFTPLFDCRISVTLALYTMSSPS